MNISRKAVRYYLFFFLMTGILFPFTGGCSSSQEEGFAIYLTKDDIPPSQMEMLSHVEITDEPLISESSIISYDAITHEIRLTDEGSQRISDLSIPVNGKSFVVCIDKNPIYWGSFMAMYSSFMLPGITIIQVKGADTIHIGTGYPVDGLIALKDPRNNAQVMQSLKDSGKLINELSVIFLDELPRSMKGYELYSWQENGEWHFRLITGTNRNKTYEEILYGETTVSDFVSIHVKGEETVKTILGKLAEDEEVFWFNQFNPVSEEEITVEFSLPDQDTIDRITRYAEICGIQLRVPAEN